jgi:hypothetical protein
VTGGAFCFCLRKFRNAVTAPGSLIRHCSGGSVQVHWNKAPTKPTETFAPASHRHPTTSLPSWQNQTRAQRAHFPPFFFAVSFSTAAMCRPEMVMLPSSSNQMTTRLPRVLMPEWCACRDSPAKGSATWKHPKSDAESAISADALDLVSLPCRAIGGRNGRDNLRMISSPLPPARRGLVHRTE